MAVRSRAPRSNLERSLTCLFFSTDVIERLIHGPEAVYNDISRWKWQELLNFFNADGHPHKTWLAETRGQFEEILGNEEFAKADKCQLIEVKMDRLDAPRALQLQAEMVSPPFASADARRRSGAKTEADFLVCLPTERQVELRLASRCDAHSQTRNIDLCCNPSVSVLQTRWLSAKR